jgi:hypothetical protein
MSARCYLVAVVFTAFVANGAAAQTDEIQVYTGELAAPGTASLTIHSNYTAKGPTTAGQILGRDSSDHRRPHGGLGFCRESDFGLTSASDKVVLKLILAHTF